MSLISRTAAALPTTTTSTTSARVRSSARSARVAIGSAAAATAAIGLAHVVRPDLDPSWAPISEHALGRGGWVMTAGFLLWSLAGWAAAASLRPHVTGRWGKVGLALLAVAATGPLLAGLAPADPMTVPNAATTLHGTIHGIGAALSDALLPATVILTVHLTRAGRSLRGARARLIGATALVWAAASFLTVQMATYLSAPGVALGPDTPVGLANRAHVLACIVCFAVFAHAARRAGREHDTRS